MKIFHFLFASRASSQLASLPGIAILVLAGCAAQQGQPPASAAKPRSSTPAESALNTADEVLQQMSRITGLPVRATLRKELVSKGEVERYLQDNLHAEYTPQEMHGEEAALKAFGVVAPDFSLEKFLVSFFTEQAAGFYDPRRKTMFMADWVSPDQQSVVLAHELTHALQDQSFDLWHFAHAVRDNDDAMNARDALLEGYATLAMVQTTLGSVPVEKLPSMDSVVEQSVTQQMAEFPVYSSSPFFLRFQLLFPYVQGVQFSRRALELGGWKRLNQVFADPPTSTRQIFQPDLYFGADQSGPNPSSVPAPAAARRDPELALPPPPALQHAAGIKQVEDNVMGALGYYALFGQLLSVDASRKVSGSWVADRYIVYQGPAPGDLILVSRTRWENPEAASDFCAAYQTILEKRWAEPAAGASKPPDRVSGTDGAAPEVLLRTSGARRTILLRQGDECRWMEGVPAKQADALAGWLKSLP